MNIIHIKNVEKYIIQETEANSEYNGHLEIGVEPINLIPRLAFGYERRLCLRFTIGYSYIFSVICSCKGYSNYSGWARLDSRVYITQ